MENSCSEICCQNLKKIHMKKLIFSKVTGSQPRTLLKKTSSYVFFKDFDCTFHLDNFKNSYFKPFFS